MTATNCWIIMRMGQRQLNQWVVIYRRSNRIVRNAASNPSIVFGFRTRIECFEPQMKNPTSNKLIIHRIYVEALPRELWNIPSDIYMPNAATLIPIIIVKIVTMDGVLQ